MIKKLTLTNFLSFGEPGVTVDLGSLNVLIGPNGSGKSNFIEALRLLSATPADVTPIIAQGGGMGDWVWKGGSKSLFPMLQVDISTDDNGENTLQHTIRLGTGPKVEVQGESIDLLNVAGHLPDVNLYYFDSATASILRGVYDPALGDNQPLEEIKSLKSNHSILAQRRDPVAFPYLTLLASTYEQSRFFAETRFGRAAPARKPQDAASSQEFLFEDASNLALVLNDLNNRPQVIREIVDKLKLFYARAEGINTYVNGGTVQVFIDEGLKATIPATRLSDGTLRYLCLLVILCHPNPPPLICIEEPELGMHPDIISTIAELLIEASKRTQLVVTTHSDFLISALRDVPESILVCDYTNDGTTIKHLDPENLAAWMEDYSIGEAWLKGAFGGTRW